MTHGSSIEVDGLAEAEEFFRRGDEGTYEGGPAQVLAEPIDPLEDESFQPVSLAQQARRARFVRVVAAAVSVLGVASVVGLGHRLLAGRFRQPTALIAETEGTSALGAAPAGGIAAEPPEQLAAVRSGVASPVEPPERARSEPGAGSRPTQPPERAQVSSTARRGFTATASPDGEPLKRAQAEPTTAARLRSPAVSTRPRLFAFRVRSLQPPSAAPASDPGRDRTGGSQSKSLMSEVRSVLLPAEQKPGYRPPSARFDD